MSDLAIVLALLAAAIVMFAINKPRLDAVALIMLTALPLTGVLTMGEALAGFSDPNIVLIAALFVIGDGLVRTGVARQLGDWLIVKAGRSEIRLIVLLMVAVCGLGATMSSTAVTAIFIPVVLRISQEHRCGAGPADDAAQLCRTHKRHDDACRDRAEPSRKWRARTPRRRGLQLLQLYAVRPAGPRPRHHLHVLRASLATRYKRGEEFRRYRISPPGSNNINSQTANTVFA